MHYTNNHNYKMSENSDLKNSIDFKNWDKTQKIILSTLKTEADYDKKCTFFNNLYLTLTKEINEKNEQRDKIVQTLLELKKMFVKLDKNKDDVSDSSDDFVETISKTKAKGKKVVKTKKTVNKKSDTKKKTKKVKGKKKKN